MVFSDMEEAAGILRTWKKEAAVFKKKCVSERSLTENELGKLISEIEAEVAEELGERNDDSDDEDEDGSSDESENGNEDSGDDDDDEEREEAEEDGEKKIDKKVDEVDEDHEAEGAAKDEKKEKTGKKSTSKHVQFTKVSSEVFESIELLGEDESPIEPMSKPTLLYIGRPATLHRFVGFF
jgi:cobalamin biosynthesis protein CobT